MILQTHIPFTTAKSPIDYRSKVLLMGSCFSEHIGGKLEYFKFQNETNPFGIVFHPLAIERLITRAINEEEFSEEDVFCHQDQWHCFDAHSILSATSKAACLKNLNDGLSKLKHSLSEASHVILTFGTAWVYRHLDSDTVVANCHKIPQKKFSKELLSVAEVSASIDRITTLLMSVQPSITIIGTVSPVRHLKDGFVENTRSKAHLITGLHDIVEDQRGVHYFPSYELMMDELRDYRFYAEDMLHPNQTAILLIWDKFSSVWLDPSTHKLSEQIEVVQKGLRHRPFNETGEAHQKFLQGLQQKITHIQQQLPSARF